MKPKKKKHSEITWPAFLMEKRLSGIYQREARIIEHLNGNTLLEIKTEKGKITITARELENILERLVGGKSK